MDFLITLSINVVAAFVAVWIHEMPKYYVSLYLTRPAFRSSAKIKGAWLKCIDPIGLILFAFMGVGWQMPLKVDSTKLTNKRNGLLAIFVTGQLSVLIIALFAGLMYWHVLTPLTKFVPLISYETLRLAIALVFRLSFYCTVLFVVNLLPIPPLDMTKLIYALSSDMYFKILQNGRMIQSVFVLFVAFGGLSTVSKLVFSSIHSLIR